MTRTRPLQTAADLRAERHARTFLPRQLPPPDPRVARLAADGYVAVQIASMLRMPVADVRLQLATHSQTITTTREAKR
jgi:hypothetical protein